LIELSFDTDNMWAWTLYWSCGSEWRVLTSRYLTHVLLELPVEQVQVIGL